MHFTASETVDVELRTAFTPDRAQGLWTAEVDGTTYGLVSEGSLSVTGASLDYAVEAERVTTRIRYETEGDPGTLVAALPHQHGALLNGNDCGEGSYPSVYGEIRLCAANTLSWSAPLLEPSGQLDLSGLNDAQRAELADQVVADVESSLPFAEDTSFGGKSLYRSANLMSVARAAGVRRLRKPLVGERHPAVRRLPESASPCGRPRATSPPCCSATCCSATTCSCTPPLRGRMPRRRPSTSRGR